MLRKTRSVLSRHSVESFEGSFDSTDRKKRNEKLPTVKQNEKKSFLELIFKSIRRARVDVRRMKKKVHTPMSNGNKMNDEFFNSVNQHQ